MAPEEGERNRGVPGSCADLLLNGSRVEVGILPQISAATGEAEVGFSLCREQAFLKGDGTLGRLPWG